MLSLKVWTIDKEGGLVIRTDISPNEPVGRKWKLLKSAPELSEVDSKFSNGGKPKGSFLSLLHQRIAC